MKRLAVPLALALIAVLAWFSWPGDGASTADAALERGARSQGRLTEAPELDAQLAPDPSAAAADPRREAAAREGARVSQPEEATAPEAAEVRGRMLLPGGAPARGVRLSLNANGIQLTDGVQRADPGDFERPEPQVTPADGRFRFRFDPPPGLMYQLAVALPGHAAESWSWRELEPGELLDLGDLELLATGEVLVRLIDGEGRPLGAGWIVHAEALHPEAELATVTRNTRNVFSVRREADDRFLLTNVPAQKVRLFAQSSLVDRAPGPKLRVRAGRRSEATIRYKGPDLSASLRLACRSHRFPADPARQLESVRLTRDGKLIALGETEPRSWTYEFEDLEPGLYTLEIRDPRFKSWIRTGVKPGRTLRASLKGSAALVLSVVDDATGARLESYRLRIRLEESRTWPNESLMQKPGDALPAGGLFDGLLPVPQVLSIEAPGYADYESPRLELLPGETRRLEVRLQRGAQLGGRFSSALDDGAIGQASVFLLPAGSNPRDLPPSRQMRVMTGREYDLPEIQREVRSDEHGRFRFESLPPGEYALIGRVNDWLVATLDPVVVRAGTTRLDLELRARDDARLDGRIVAPPRADFGGLLVEAELEAESVWPRHLLEGAPIVELDAAGRFSFPSLPPGLVTLRLTQAPPKTAVGLGLFVERRGLEMVLAEVELQAGERRELTVELSEGWPGSLRLEVREGDRAMPGLVVLLKPTDEERVVGSGASDSHGVARIERIEPGDYEVHLLSPRDGWSWNSEQLVSIASGEQTRATVGYTLASGVILCLDAAAGAPLSKRAVCLLPPRGVATAAPRRTGPDGRLELTLPIGRYFASLVGGRGLPGAPVEFEWTRGGPAPAEVRLAKPE